jgi:hypothetical protein
MIVKRRSQSAAKPRLAFRRPFADGHRYNRARRNLAPPVLVKKTPAGGQIHPANVVLAEATQKTWK